MNRNEVIIGFIVLLIAATTAVYWFGTPGLYGVLIALAGVALIVIFFLWRSSKR